MSNSVSIRPGVAILSVLRHLNYKPWFAIAEFVDNSIQSYLNNREALEACYGPDFKLRVHVEFDSTGNGRLIVRDNAAGIALRDFPRAFRPAEVPQDRSGLSEFGMGLKSAACWFAPMWTVRTTALGEPIERSITFNISKIVADNIEELVIAERAVPATHHYTEVDLCLLHDKPHGRTIAKIKTHLSSIYRVFIKSGVLQIKFGNETLDYQDPEILDAPYFKDELGPSLQWQKMIDIDLGLGLRAYGFAALRRVGSVNDAGFALFRRDRLIEGSADEGYRPEIIFGKPNSFTYQRLFGELHLEGFGVSHTKDGFQWREHESTFLDLLKEELNQKPLQIIDQAEGYRVRAKREELNRGARVAVESTAEVVARDAPQVINPQLNTLPVVAAPPEQLPQADCLSASRIVKLELDGYSWEVIIELSNDPAVGDWLTVSDNPLPHTSSPDKLVRRIGVRLAMAHPFMDRFCGADSMRIEPLLRVAVGLALAETTARLSGVGSAGTIRKNLNELLREALSRPQ